MEGQCPYTFTLNFWYFSEKYKKNDFKCKFWGLSVARISNCMRRACGIRSMHMYFLFLFGYLSGKKHINSMFCKDANSHLLPAYNLCLCWGVRTLVMSSHFTCYKLDLLTWLKPFRVILYKNQLQSSFGDKSTVLWLTGFLGDLYGTTQVKLEEVCYAVDNICQHWCYRCHIYCVIVYCYKLPCTLLQEPNEDLVIFVFCYVMYYNWPTSLKWDQQLTNGTTS